MFWGLKTVIEQYKWESAFVFSKPSCWHKELCSGSLEIRKEGRGGEQRRGMDKGEQTNWQRYIDVLQPPKRE